MRTFHSNCLIVAMKEKLMDWNNVKLVPIWHGFHFHMMWLDKRENVYKHFTHRLLPGKFTTLWFRGNVEKVKPEHLERWCKKNNAKLRIRQFVVKYNVDGKEKTAIVLCDSKPEARKIVQGREAMAVEFTSIKEMAK